MLDLPRQTAVVCHDAGAANVIIAGLLATGRKDWRTYVEGPAHKLWCAAFPCCSPVASLQDALSDAGFVITGTGWSSDLEHDARRVARDKGIRSAAVIDHWVNYAQRFVRDGRQVWPDEFWICDEEAESIARQTFPGQDIRRITNQYVAAQLRAICAIKSPAIPELLYPTEPSRSEWGSSSPGEFQALDYFVERLPELGLPGGLVVRLRPHPSEQPDKYASWIKEHDELNIVLDDSPSIAEALGRATWVAGCETSVLALALMAGRKVFCTLPPWAPALRLPHAGIVQLRDI